MDKINRRKFISRSLAGMAGVAATAMVPIGLRKWDDNESLTPTEPVSNNPTYTESGENLLPIPPLLKNVSTTPNKAEFHLNAQIAKKEFISGKATDTFGYNGDYLGPVIRVRKGEDVSIKVKNELNEDTTVHWHGLEVNGEDDGGPHSVIKPGETWNPQFTINQPAATLWYHPHILHKTGEQVYKGLAGLFYIDDEDSDRLDIPNEYGVDDVPLVIQDKRLDANGRFEYKLSMHDMMMGLQGGSILVNGAIAPTFEVLKGKVRFRILNGSNAKIYQFVLSNNASFYQIASDGGFLDQPVKMTNLILSPGERAEIIVDFSNYQNGDVVELTNQGSGFMKFVVNSKNKKEAKIPEALVPVKKIDNANVSATRKFVLQGMGRGVNINGKQMDMERIDEKVKINSTEIWEISNESRGMMGEMPHPFHAHGVQFQILDRDGNPPPANETGWKDTILVYGGEKVRAIATFNHPGIFMYHCHILEHEDLGMMGQFKVE